MKTKDEVIELLSGPIESASHDDLRFQRDRLLALAQNVEGLSTKDYREMVKSLTIANNRIEAVLNAKSQECF